MLFPLSMLAPLAIMAASPEKTERPSDVSQAAAKPFITFASRPP
jgi:hypothetical protein